MAIISTKQTNYLTHFLVVSVLLVSHSVAHAIPFKYGSAFATGDFNNDGIDDVAIGVPFSDLTSHGSAEGEVLVVLGGQDLRNDSRRFATLYIDSSVVGGRHAGEHFGSSLAAGDFNGDGRSDLAIGIPDRTVNGASKAGAVAVLFSDAHGLSFSDAQLLTQNNTAATSPEPNDRFGLTLAAGDFNGDNFADLAVGVPEEDWNSSVNAGIVHLFDGSAGTDRLIHLPPRTYFPGDLEGVPGDHEPGAQFGFALSAEDLNGDNFTDLAVSAPFKTVGGNSNAGQVTLLFGEAARLNSIFARDAQIIHQDLSDLPGSAAVNDNFGFSLAIGNINSAGGVKGEDILIGIPGKRVNGRAEAGAVMFIPVTGVGPTYNILLAKSRQLGSGAGNQNSARFGSAMASGVVGNLAHSFMIGAPGANSEAGNATVYYGDRGIAILGDMVPNGVNQTFYQQGATANQSTEPLPGEHEDGDSFGSAIAFGDFDNDGRGDFIVGVPGEDEENRRSGCRSDWGAAIILFGKNSPNSSQKIIGSDDATILFFDPFPIQSSC